MSERITATLPMDGLLFWKLEGEEALSNAFTLQVTLLSSDARIERRALLGQPITLSIPVQGLLATRYLNGKITSVKVHSEELSGTRYAVYSLTMEPDLWPMKRDRNLRIFQNQTVPQIIKSLLHEYNVTIEDKLSGNYRLWEYCVQYQESSFNFISRLMELEGIYYFFRHQQDQHVMVLMDTISQHQPYPGYEMIPYHVTASGGVTSEQGVSQWALEDHVTPGIYSLDDYDFRQPNALLFQARQNPVSPLPGEIDVFDWPGHYVEHQHGENYARIRQQVWQAEHQKISGTGTALGIAPGHTFLLHNTPWLTDNGEYLTIKANYKLVENRYASGSDNQVEKQIEFIVIPADCPFRAPPKSRWPKTCGPQTAKVVGPRGESIWTDKYGRIKVKFHWDRLAKGDDSSSCWVRVSSAWAGQGYGGVQIPRVNDEVVIDFINGDPDRPMVIGRVYNEASMPPWSLPAAATQMGFISRSKNGTPDNANALRFEDKAGAEQVWIQAERNMDTHIKQNASHHIGSNHTHFVGASEEQRVAENQLQAVKGASNLLTGKSKSDSVADDHVLAAGDLLRLECGKSAIELTAAGKINLVGTGFNIFVEGDGWITTSGGALKVNTEAGVPTTSAPGDGHRELILQAVEEQFLLKKGGITSVVSKKAEHTKTPVVQKAQMASKIALDERVVKSIMRSEGVNGEQGNRKEIYGFRKGNGTTYNDILLVRNRYGVGSDEEYEVVAKAMNESAKKAGALNFSDPGKQAAVMSMAHMRGVGGAQAILNSMLSGKVVKASKLTTEAKEYIESMNSDDFHNKLMEARMTYDERIYGSSTTMQNGIKYNWLDRYGDGLMKRYKRESVEFIKISRESKG